MAPTQYRDFWITLRAGHTLRGHLNPRYSLDGRADLVDPELPGFGFLKRARSLGIIELVPVIRDGLLMRYEQAALGLDVLDDSGSRIDSPQAALKIARHELARYAPDQRLSLQQGIGELDRLRDAVPMFHPYYRLRVAFPLAQRILSSICQSEEVAAAVEAPRLVTDAWPPQDPLLAELSPTFDGLAIQLSDEAWHPKLREQWNLEKTGVIDAWKTLQGDPKKRRGMSRVTVGIIDSGVEFSHPDLQGSRALGSDDCILPRPDRPALDPHGTLVAGIIGARSNERGICGIAPESKLLSLVHGGAPITSATPPPDMEIDVSECAEAIVRAVRSGADVINLSWHAERTCCDTDAFFQSQLQGPLLEGILLATLEKVPVVCSTGNRSHLSYPTPYISYPAALDELKYKGTVLQVISVGAVDQNLRRTPSSNYIPLHDDVLKRHDRGHWPTLMAPGYSVPTTDLKGRPGVSHGRYVKLSIIDIMRRFPRIARRGFTASGDWVADYAPFGGTSAAAPHVTGVIALMLSVVGTRRVPVADIKSILKKTARGIASENADQPEESYGAGLVNAAGAISTLSP